MIVYQLPKPLPIKTKLLSLDLVLDGREDLTTQDIR